MVRTLTAGEWSETVERSGGTVVVQFGAPWCGWCKRLEPIVDRLAEALAGEVSFFRLDVDQFPEMRERFGIEGIPVLIRFEDGRLAEQVVGYRPQPQVRAFALRAHGASGAPEELAAHFDNAATSDNGDPAAADADGVGWSLSAQALAAAGLTPGAELVVDGLAFQWPDVPAGAANNAQAAGQAVRLPARPGAARLGVLGMATHGPCSGQATVRYTDGSTKGFTLSFSDWTLNGGGGPLAPGTRVAVRMPYRNSEDGGSFNLQETMLFVASVALEAGKTAESLTLPGEPDEGTLHVFAVAVGG